MIFLAFLFVINSIGFNVEAQNISIDIPCYACKRCPIIECCPDEVKIIDYSDSCCCPKCVKSKSKNSFNQT